jgi:DNA-binding NtrC family response regulator
MTNIETEDPPTLPTSLPPSVAIATACVLEIQDHEDVRRIPLMAGEPLVLGSSRAANVRLNDPGVSARHCEITLQNGIIGIRDLNSRNGTYVGGARLERAQCSVGTVLSIGTSSILVQRFSASMDEVPLEQPLPGLAGASAVMRRLAAQVRRLASQSAPVLICGETGTGKELIAHALHHEGPRRSAPFVPVNVASLPRDLVESELFGHERGAFTGAVMRKHGAFEEASGGTLFLDEIGELPLEAQPKLLRALDGYELRRVGGGRLKQDARVVAATHVALEHSVDAGTFRRDLFHRLEVFVLHVPPLRERSSDILPIAKAILRRAAPEIGLKSLTSQAAAILASGTWHGNVRELRNALLRAADRSGSSPWIDAEHLQGSLKPSQTKVELTPQFARDFLRKYANNISAAARAAGYPRSTFRKILQAV